MKNTFYFTATMFLSIILFIFLVTLVKGITIRHCLGGEQCEIHSFMMVENTQQEVIHEINCGFCVEDQCIRRELNQEECSKWLEMMKESN